MNFIYTCTTYPTNGTITMKTLYSTSIGAHASLGQKTNANSAPVVLSSGQAIPTNPLIVQQAPQQLAAFGDMKVAEDTPELYLLFSNNINPALTSSFAADGGSISQANSMAVLQTSTNPAGQQSMDSLKYVQYLPGQGLIFKGTGVFTAGVANSQQELGIDNNVSNDGLMFGFVGANFGIIHRIGGVDTFISQANWNQDPLNGNGPSGLNFDPTVGNVYKIQMQYLGFGPIYYWVENPQTGMAVLVHKEPWGGTTDAGGGGHTTPSLNNPTLGLHARVINTGNTSNLTLKTASLSLAREGKEGSFSLQGGVSNRKAALTQNVATELFAVKVKTLFGNDAGSQVRVRLRSLNVEASNDCTFALILNPTIGGSPAFQDFASTTSVVQVDTAGTSIGDGGVFPNGTGGSVIFSAAITGVSSTANPLWNEDILLNPGDVLAISATALASGSTNAAASLNWLEQF
jgi:hypothetical protein